MAIFPSMLITKQGQTLYNKAQAGNPINFTKMKLGSGRLATGQDQTILTSLIDYKFDVPISNITQNTQLQIATITGFINNSNITTGTYICELGMFAQDPDLGEILYAYTNSEDQGDYYAPASRGPFTWSYQINAAIGNASNVTANLVNSSFDYSLESSSTFKNITGINQKEINESIDNALGNQVTKYAITKNVKLTATSPTNIITYTPNLQGNFEIDLYLRVTATANITVTVSYADDTGPQTKNMLYQGGGLYFPCSSGIQSYAAGSYPLVPLFINAVAGTPIIVSVTTNIANQVYVSSSIVGV